METYNGRVIRSVGDYHTVSIRAGREVLCRARGRLKQRGAVVTGDLVRVGLTGKRRRGDRGGRRPGQTYLYRPTDRQRGYRRRRHGLGARPSPSLELVDRLLALAEREGLSASWSSTRPIWSIRPRLQAARAPYVAAGYPVFLVSAADGRGDRTAKASARGQVSILAGPSGVGQVEPAQRTLARKPTARPER